MKKLFLTAVMLLWAVAANAVCHTYHFDAQPYVWQTAGSFTDGNQTITFSDGFMRTFDRDACPTCVPAGMQQTDYMFSLANEPSGNGVITMYNYGNTPGLGPYLHSNTAFKYARLSYSSGFTYCHCYDPECQYDFCTYGSLFNRNGDHSRLYMTLDPYWQGGYPSMIKADVPLLESGYMWEGEMNGDYTQYCAGDPNGVFCGWPVAEISGPAVHDLQFHISLGPFFLDELTLCDDLCPNPPCSFERVVPVERTSWGQLKLLYR